MRPSPQQMYIIRNFEIFLTSSLRPVHRTPYYDGFWFECQSINQYILIGPTKCTCFELIPAPYICEFLILDSIPPSQQFRNQPSSTQRCLASASAQQQPKLQQALRWILKAPAKSPAEAMSTPHSTPDGSSTHKKRTTSREPSPSDTSR